MENRRKGFLLLKDQEISIDSPYDAICHGLGMVTEDRKTLGLILHGSVAENISLASLNELSSRGIVNSNQEIMEVSRYIEDLGVKTPSIETRIENLSGGNQQKALLARSLMRKPEVLFLDEPTRGIDVGAKYEIYILMNALVKQGTSIIMVSSELPEILGMSDRVLVMCEGEITGEFSADEATQEKIMAKAAGQKV